VQAIQALDDLDRFLNLMSERVSEWYGLHFPELTQIMQDNVLLSKLIVETGKRENFDKERLEGRGLSDKKIEAIITARDRSKGGTISERDIIRLSEIADLAIKTSTDRDHMAEYVETTMAKISPNVAAVAGSTIGARLIARAGGLDRLANLPASTIQILGAEKALFRALRTGARPPKHGIIFQHDAVHSAPKWQRGKIARTIANKIAIAARIDYYRGEPEKSLIGLLEKRLQEIRIKYKEPRPVAPQRRRFANEKPSRGRKGRPKRNRH
jgi:nucleolar protein 56